MNVYKIVAAMTTEEKDQIISLVIELDQMDAMTAIEEQAKVVHEIQKLIRVETTEATEEAVEEAPAEEVEDTEVEEEDTEAEAA